MIAGFETLVGLQAPLAQSVAMFYLGPDTVLPVGSAVAAGIGVGLIVWNRAIGALRRAITYCSRRFKG
jgi:hypothetical protein